MVVKVSAEVSFNMLYKQNKKHSEEKNQGLKNNQNKNYCSLKGEVKELLIKSNALVFHGKVIELIYKGKVCMKCG